MKTSISPTTGLQAVRFNLEIAVRCDFADIFEVKSKHIVRRGRITSQWSPAKAQLGAVYRNCDFSRDVTICVRRSSSTRVYANGRLSFEVEMEPGGAWHACFLYRLTDGRAISGAGAVHRAVRERPWKSVSKEWKIPSSRFAPATRRSTGLFTQAVEDMSALRLPIKGTGHVSYVPAVVRPGSWRLFGRDSLIASFKHATVYPEFCRPRRSRF